MLVTSDTSQSAISAVPAAPQSAPWLQHATPVASTAMQLSTAAFSAARSGNAHDVSPAAGSSPAALVPPPEQGAHTPISTRSFSGHGFWTVHSPGGPSVVSTPSPREKSASHVTAPVNIPVVFAPSAKVHALTPARRNPEAPWNIPRASVTCDISHWLMSTLNCDLPSNKKLMSVTCETSQWGMVSSHSRSPTHASTAALSSALVVTSRVHTASVSTRSVHDVTPSST